MTVKKLFILLALLLAGVMLTEGVHAASLQRTVSFSGKIQGNKQYFFNMQLTFYDDETVHGSYIVVNGANENVFLKGLYDETNGIIMLYEYDVQGRKTGYYFTGTCRLVYSETTYRCIGYILEGRYKKNGTKVNWPFRAESYQFS